MSETRQGFEMGARRLEGQILWRELRKVDGKLSRSRTAKQGGKHWLRENGINGWPYRHSSGLRFTGPIGVWPPNKAKTIKEQKCHAKKTNAPS